MAPGGGTHLVVDGSNIATEGRTLPSLVQLDEAVRALLEHEPHDAWTVVVDATFEHRIDPSESRMYDEALSAGELLTPPAGTIGRGDKFLLEIADRVGATVFSNDSFQEFHAEYPWLFDGGRLIGGKPVPGVGWIFAERSPVRGPKSRMVTREAAKRTRTASKAASAPLPVPTTPPPAPAERMGRKRAAASSTTTRKAAAKAPSSSRARKSTTSATAAIAEEAAAAVVAEVVAEVAAGAADEGGRGRARRRGRTDAEAVNDGLAFVEFIAEHPVGALVEGTVDSFSSHGAWVLVGDVRCYAPLRALGEPAPRSARDVLRRGEAREFVVDTLDAPRRGIDLALPGFERPEAAAGPEFRPDAADTTVGVGAVGQPTAPPADQAPAAAGATQPESEAILATTPTTRTKKAAKKTKAAATKRGTAVKRKATTTKATAKKATTKGAAKKTTAKKTTATAKRAPAAGKAAAKATAKATAKKATTKRAPAKKATTARTKKAGSPVTKATKSAKKAKATGRTAVKKATRAVKKATR